MADVRAEILAASRSRTGWLEGSVQNNESQPFVSKVKSTFEEKTVNQDTKLVTSSSKTEAVRRLGSKVSSIATLFQSFSPHKSECSKTSNAPSVNKGGVEKTSPKNAKTDHTNKLDSNTEISSVNQNDESHQKRFNSARAIFEQLGEKSKESNRLSDIPKGDYLPEVFNSGSSKSLVNERDKTPNQSNRNSSQSSPDEELRNLPFCRKTYNQRAPSHQKSEKKDEGEKAHSENFSSPDNSKDCHSHTSDYTDNLASHYSQIYEEIPNSGKESSKYSWNAYSETCDHSENSLKTQEDKNANTTNSYDFFSSHPNEPVDSSMPIYAKVIKKRSKHPSNFNKEDQQSSVVKSTADSCKEHNSGDDEKEHLNFKTTLDQTFYSSQSNKNGSHSKDKSQTSVNNSLTENVYAEIKKPDNVGKPSDSFNDSWENIGVTTSNSWKKKSSEGSNNQDESEPRGFYEVSSGLRDAAGETLAEFESREHELFFVEAVLRSQRQGGLDEPFSNHKHNSSESKVDFIRKEEDEDHFTKSQEASLDKHDQSLTSNSQSILDSDQSETWSVPNSVMGETDDDDLGSEDCSQTITFPPGTNVLYEDINYHILSDGHFITELPGLNDESDDDDIFCPVPPKRKSKVRFNYDPIKVYSTHSVEDYDRHNDDVDPVAASAEYELEKRIEKMDVFPVELVKGTFAYVAAVVASQAGKIEYF